MAAGYLAVALAADGQYLYALHEGVAPGSESPRRNKGVVGGEPDQTRYEYDFNVTRYDSKAGTVAPYSARDFTWLNRPYKRLRNAGGGAARSSASGR